MDSQSSSSIMLSNPAAEFTDNRLVTAFHPFQPDPNAMYDPAVDKYRRRDDILL